MTELDAVKKIVAPFLTHGICRDEAEEQFLTRWQAVEADVS